MDRAYFVIDMKSFFASVECHERGLDAMTTKLVVADERRTDKTVCLAVSPALKKLGVRNRCRLFEVPKDINFIIAPPQMSKYIEYASRIYGIYLKYIDKRDIHVYSIDECIIDVTEYLKLYKIRAKDFAKKLMGEILLTLGIPSSCGIGTNMYLAKIALDLTAKHAPDRIGFLDEKRYQKTLWDYKPITDFWQISTGTASRLARFGIYTMRDITEFDEDALYREFGVNAELLIDHAWGREPCLMSDIKGYKSKSHSISSSQILPTNYSFEDARVVMREMIQNGCYDLSRYHQSTEQIYVYIGYGDSRHAMTKGGAHIGSLTNVYSIIGERALEVFDSIVDKSRPIRRLGYAFCDLAPESQEYYDFFTNLNSVNKEKKAVSTILGLKAKYGKNSVLKAIDYDKHATQKDRNETIGGHRSGKEE